MSTSRNGRRRIRLPLNRLYLEYTNRCNMACAFCPYPYQNRAKGKLDPDLLRKIVDDVVANRISTSIEVTGYGEPLMHPDWYEISRTIIDGGIRLNITTNGALLTEATSEKLADLDCDDVIISLQTPSEASFPIRKAAITYDSYVARLRRFIEIHTRRRSRSRIRLRFLNTAGTAHMSFPEEVSVLDSRDQLVTAIQEWIGIVGEVTGHRHDRAVIARRLRGVAQVQPTMIHVTDNVTLESYFCNNYWIHGTGYRVRFPTRIARCRAMTFESALIYHDGDVSLCCSDYDGFLRVGSLRKQTLTEVMRSEKAAALIDGFRRFRVKHPYCQGCLGADSLPLKAVKALCASLYMLSLSEYREVDLRD